MARGPGRDGLPLRRSFAATCVVPFLTNEELRPLFDYLDRRHTTTWDPNFVGQTTAIGKRVWDRAGRSGSSVALPLDIGPAS